MSITYYSPIKSGDVVYSCDMIRLRFHINQLKAQNFMDYFHIMTANRHFLYDYFRSTKIGSYRHLFACKYSKADRTEGTFRIGLALNECSHTSGMSCMIEFNPNKNDMVYMRHILEDIAYFVTPVLHYFELMRFDLAVDIPVKRENVVLLKQGKREYHRIISNSLTEYVGRHNSNGFTKVYDKTVESDLDYDLTRVEITCDNLDIFSLPKLQLLQSVEDDFTELNSTDIVLVNLIRRLDYDEQQFQLKMLGRNKRDKLKKYIFPYQQDFEFDMNAMHWVVTWIEEMMYCWQWKRSELKLSVIDNKIEKENIKDDEVFEQYTLFDK